MFVGVQIPGAMHGINHVDGGLRHAVFLALAVTGVVIVTRIVWVELTTLLGRVVDREHAPTQPCRQLSSALRHQLGGIPRRRVSCRGVGRPTAPPLNGRTPFPDRSLLIFVVVVVILVTVMVQGTTLPAVVRWARMPEDVAHAEELQLARSRRRQAALEALPVVADQLGVGPKLLSRLQKEYEEHAALVMANGDDSTTSGLAEKSDLVRRVRLGVLEHQRRAVTALRNQNRIDDIVLRELQVELDLEEVQLLGRWG